MDETLTLALDTINKNKQALVFVSSRASAERTAEDISKQTKLNLFELSQKVLKAVSSPTKQCRRLSHCIKKGIAFHHAGLTQKQKDLIETGFRSGDIKIICCTPTLAAGLSMPAFRVILKSLKRYSGRWGMDWIPILEYYQMAGRAGRPEFEAYGEAISVAKNDAEKLEIYGRYVCGHPEEIYSKLAVEPVFRTYLLSLIASGITSTKKEIVDFFSKTFWAHQFKDMDKIELMIDKMLDLLEEYEFLVVGGESGLPKSDFVSAVDLGDSEDVVVKATLIGKRVSQLYLDPFTANHIMNGLRKCSDSSINVTAFSFLQTISHTLEMYPPLRIKASEHDEVQERLVERYNQLLESEPDSYDVDYSDFMNSIKTALFFEEWIDEKDEDYLLEKFGIRPGEIYGKLDTADWLLYSASELARLMQFHPLLSELNKLRVRVKNGVREELLTLLKLKGIGRKRARKLFNNGLKHLGELKAVDVNVLGQIIGKAVAIDVKKQLGEEVKEVSDRKRKGQMGLGKYK